MAPASRYHRCRLQLCFNKMRNRYLLVSILALLCSVAFAASTIAAEGPNVISYRSRFAVRDAARALGFSPGQQDAWSKQIDRWGPMKSTLDNTDEVPPAVIGLAKRLE